MDNQINATRSQGADASSRQAPSPTERNRELLAKTERQIPLPDQGQSLSGHAHGDIESARSAPTDSRRPASKPTAESRELHVSSSEHVKAVESAIRMEVEKADLTLAERQTVMDRVQENIARSNRRLHAGTPLPREPGYQLPRDDVNKDKELDR